MQNNDETIFVSDGLEEEIKDLEEDENNCFYFLEISNQKVPCLVKSIKKNTENNFLISCATLDDLTVRFFNKEDIRFKVYKGNDIILDIDIMKSNQELEIKTENNDIYIIGFIIEGKDYEF